MSSALRAGLPERPDEIAFAVEDDSGWQSQHASVASNTGPVSGNGNCRNLT